MDEKKLIQSVKGFSKGTHRGYPSLNYDLPNGKVCFVQQGISSSDIYFGIEDDSICLTSEIVEAVMPVFEEFLKKGGSIKSIIITGGLSFSEGTAEILEERLGFPVKMGIVKNVQGNISSTDSLRAVTAIGLARYAALNLQPKTAQARNIAQNISNKVVEIFNNYF